MKNKFHFVLVFGLFSILSFAQETLKFSYDDAGNQVKRETPVVKPPTELFPQLPSEFKIYPNPTSGKFYIEWTEAYKGKVLQIAVTPTNASNFTNIIIRQVGDNDLKAEFDITPQVAGVFLVDFWLKAGTMFFAKIMKQ